MGNDIPTPQGEVAFDLVGTPPDRKRRVWLDTLNGFFYDYEAKLPDDFAVGRMAGSHVGGLSVGRVECDAMHVWRTDMKIARDGLDAYFVLLPSGPMIGLRQGDRDAAVDGKTFTLVSAARPYTYIQDRRTAFDNVIVPGEVLRNAVANVDDFVAVGRGGRSVDSFFMDYARSFCGNIIGLDECTKARASRHLVELLGAALDGADYASSEKPVRLAHLRRIKALIEQGFCDPDFGIDRVSATMRLSRRYIQDLMTAANLRFSEVLRQRRLGEAHSLLQGRQLNRLTIAEVAYRVGFSDAAYFSRTYKAQFGHTPSDTAPSARDRPYGVRDRHSPKPIGPFNPGG